MTDTATSRLRAALVTCAELPGLDVDDVPLVAALADRRVAATIVPWDDADTDWAAFDVVVVRSAWDYSTRRDLFVEWARSVPNILNAASVIEWNTDKAYLKELADRGVSTIPTVWLDPDRNLSARAVHTRMPANGDFVIKPTVSAGSKDTGRYEAGDATERGLAISHAVDLLASGRHVMIQPYVAEIDDVGETSLVYLDGRFSHAVNRRALLSGPYDASDHSVYVEEGLSASDATPAERELADRALAVAADLRPEAKRPLYARVDVVPGADGAPHLIELEMAEPSLFLRHGVDAHERFADAIALRALRARVL